jgi:multimeric flavodoxin WrbA
MSSCRACQSREEYGCVIDDEASAVLKKMTGYDVIVMASPLYFFSASAQLKVIFDRMFSLYKWDNAAGTMITPLKGKTFVLLGSAYRMSAGCYGEALLSHCRVHGHAVQVFGCANAGVSGDIKKIPIFRKRC